MKTLRTENKRFTIAILTTIATFLGAVCLHVILVILTVFVGPICAVVEKVRTSTQSSRKTNKQEKQRGKIKMREFLRSFYYSLLSIQSLSLSLSLSFYTNVTNLLKQQNNIIDDIRTKNDVNLYATKSRKTYVELWKNRLENSKKLEFYKTLKKEYNCEQYLNIIDDPLQRRDYTKFRISNHNLMIEYGRYGNTKVPKESRICLVCNTNQIEDELHLMFSCSCYNGHRTKMKMKTKISAI